jgi:hypothetical protein
VGSMLLLLSLAAAAVSSSPWDALRVEPNAVVRIERSGSAGSLKGRLVGVTHDELLVAAEGESVRVSVSDVTRLQVRSPGGGTVVATGALIGAAVGAGLGAIANAADASGHPGSLACCAVGSGGDGFGPPTSAVIGGGAVLGAFVGALTGAIRGHWADRDVRRLHVSLAPAGRMGVALTLSRSRAAR